MITDGKLMGFLTTTDYSRARAFYEGKLGFTCLGQDDFAMAFRAGENMIRIVRADKFTPAQSTVLGWEVTDIEAEVMGLRERGVETERFVFVPDQEFGIWTAPTGDKVAWFKDPDGNVLSVSQHLVS